MNNREDNRRNKPSAGSIIIFIVIVLLSTGGIFVIPLLIGGAMVYFAIKQKAGKSGLDKGDTSGSDLIKRFEDFSKRMDELEEAGNSPSLAGMLSRSERQHLETAESDFHDEFLHRSNELKDLLKAGIIENDEYKERMALLKAEFNR